MLVRAERWAGHRDVFGDKAQTGRLARAKRVPHALPALFVICFAIILLMQMYDVIDTARAAAQALRAHQRLTMRRRRQ